MRFKHNCKRCQEISENLLNTAKELLEFVKEELKMKKGLIEDLKKYEVYEDFYWREMEADSCLFEKFIQSSKKLFLMSNKYRDKCQCGEKNDI